MRKLRNLFKRKIIKPTESPIRLRQCRECGFTQYDRAGVDSYGDPIEKFKIRFVAKKNQLRFECPTCTAFYFSPTYISMLAEEKERVEKQSNPETEAALAELE